MNIKIILLISSQISFERSRQYDSLTSTGVNSMFNIDLNQSWSMLSHSFILTGKDTKYIVLSLVTSVYEIIEAWK